MKLLLRLLLLFFVLLTVSIAGNKVFAFKNLNFQQIKQQDTLRADTGKKIKPMSKSSLDSKIEYVSDSSFTDRINKVIYLYGNARVIYGGFQLDAQYIKFDSKKNTIFARGANNDKGKYFGRPIFKIEKEGTSIADSLTYNTQTSKGMVYQVFSEQEGGYFSGGKTKMQPDQEIHTKGQTYSTCNLREPHFGIHITKGIVTEKHFITGPVYMEFEGIPLPLALPFAFFPKPNKKASGFIMPTPGEDAVRGFFLTKGGYYLALNDYWDSKLTGDIYTNGSYNLNLLTNYTKRYKYDGNFNLAYSSNRNGLEGTPEYKPQKTFNIRWIHTQNANARPGTTFSASVDAGSSNHLTVNPSNGSYDINRIAQNTMSSSIAYGRVFGDGLFNFTAALSHSQETRSKGINLTLPQINLNMTSLNPFDNKIGEQLWYEKLNVGYSLQTSNQINTTEDLLFAPGSLKRFKNGIQHIIPISLPFNLLKYLNFNASTRYTEKWYLQTIDKRAYKQASGADIVVKDTVYGFKRAGEYDLSIGVSTKLYGRKYFNRLGNIKGISHIITPNISFSYKPDFSSGCFNYYRGIQYYTNDDKFGKGTPIPGQYQTDYQGKVVRYSIFENGIYGGPSIGRQGAINFSIDNTVELKLKSSNKDTTSTDDKKIAVLQGLSFSSSYNFFAYDNKKLAPINFNGRSQLSSDGKIGINFGGTFSPYAVQDVIQTIGTGNNQTINRQEINRYVWLDGKLPRLTNFTFSFGYNFNSQAAQNRNDKINKINQQNMGASARSQEQIDQLNAISRDPNAFVDFNIPWNFAFSYSFNYSNLLASKASRNIANTLNFNGDFNLTPKWKIQFNSGYDFLAKNLSYTSFTIYRDLHCWDLSASWIPFGLYQSYSVDIRVKAPILQDLKLSKRKQYYTRY